MVWVSVLAFEEKKLGIGLGCLSLSAVLDFIRALGVYF